MNWKRQNPRMNLEDINEDQKLISLTSAFSDHQPQGNKIYFYSDVSRDSVLSLNKQIDELTKQMKNLQSTYNLTESPIIELHISSDGGDVFAAMAAVDKILNSSVPIHTYCEGVVASAGTIISVVGKKRYITKNSCMLVHQVSGGLWGNYMEFKDEIKNLDLLMSLIKNVYLQRTKYKAEELDKILSHDLFLSSEECLQFGLVDVII